MLSAGDEILQRRALDLSTQIAATSAVIRSCSVFSARVTHTGHHAGVTEVYTLGCPIDEIRQLGRWVISQMESYYLPTVPINPAFYMAGFLSTKPYFIERNLVVPPLSLQRRIFPWIEQAYAEDGLDPYWTETCAREMKGDNPSQVEEKNIYEDRVLPDSDATNATKAYAQNNRRRFLQLLLRLRKVILQDTVIYLKPNSQGQTLTNSLLQLEVFRSEEFLAFQKKLLNAIESR